MENKDYEEIVRKSGGRKPQVIRFLSGQLRVGYSIGTTIGLIHIHSYLGNDWWGTSIGDVLIVNDFIIGYILTETDDFLTTEDGDLLII